ncbi:hypothetical protein MMC11_001678 [Xylographa trunciseda]|nr:hypothetical protein [Xylographa trunciseda]
MGIPGLYNELGKGKREALAKCAIEVLEKTGRPFRLAVDISIWQFQILSGKGGKNPALRTLYFRLLRFLALSIQPLFVFDGPHKPPVKRNVKTSNQGASLPNMLAKELLKHFGFPYLTAPGEAEAECALLQREGIVDAVMSEDVDTLMFGCGMSMRDWSGEGKSKAPTHVNIYSSELILRNCGLDRDGMVLVALMSGGDYDTMGIPGCGPKVACQAAKAGFGKELCKLAKGDIIGLKQWRERLNYELRTNESGYFQRKNTTIRVLDDFPDKKVFSYYAHPVISSAEKVKALKSSIQWESPVNIYSLRLFVADAFEWHYMEGASKFIRGLAPALLSQRLRQNADFSTNNLDLLAEEERKYVRGICDKPRTHFDTGGIKELRVIYIPAEIVGLDLEKEETGQYAGIYESETDTEAVGPVGGEATQCTSPAKKPRPSNYDPTIPDKIWIPESIVKLGAPLTVENWEADMRNPKKFATRKVRERAAIAPQGMKKGAMDAFLKVRKYDVERAHHERQPVLAGLENDRGLQPKLVKPPLDTMTSGTSDLLVGSDGENGNSKSKFPPSPSRVMKKATKKKRAPLITGSPLKDSNANPWTLSRRPSDTLNVNTDHGKRYSALGINCSPKTPERYRHAFSPEAGDAFAKPIMIESPLRNKIERSKQASVSTMTIGASKTHDKESCPKIMLQEASRCLHAEATRKVNRRLDFGTPAAASPLSSSPSLPSPSELLYSPPPKSHVIFQRKTVMRHHARTSSLPKSPKKHIVLRDSLNGAWRETHDWELEASTPEHIFSGVETLDLTRSQE